MSERIQQTEARIDELIGDRPEELGAFMGFYPAVERQRGWTIPEEGAVRLTRSRFLVPEKPKIQAFDSLFHICNPVRTAYTFIFTRGVGRLTMSSVFVTPEIEKAEDQEVIDKFNGARLNNQEEVEDWEYFSLLLESGKILPEDDLSEEYESGTEG